MGRNAGAILDSMQGKLSLREQGNEAFRAGDFTEASRMYEQCLKECKNSREALVLQCNLAAALLELGNAKGAARACRRALEVDPSCWKARYRHAKALEMGHHFPEAKAELEAVDLRQVPLKSQTILLEFLSRMREASKKKVFSDASPHDLEILLNQHHKLRLFFTAGFPTQYLSLEPGPVELEVPIFIGNEFGLFSRKLVEDESLKVVFKLENEKDCVGEASLSNHGRADVICKLNLTKGRHHLVCSYAAHDGSIVSVLSPPILVSSNEEELSEHERRFSFYSNCRELQGLKFLEGIGSLGISGKLWDSAIKMINVLKERRVKKDEIFIELGSGTGAVGLSCASLGAEEVYVSDLPEVVQLLRDNIDANDLKNNCKAISLPWGWKLPLEDLPTRCDFILLSDVVYDPELYEPLLQTLDQLRMNYSGVQVLWGHRHRNPDDFMFFSEFVKIFEEIELVSGMGPRFSHGIHTDLAKKFHRNEGSLDSEVDISIYLCRSKKFS